MFEVFSGFRKLKTTLDVFFSFFFLSLSHTHTRTNTQTNTYIYTLKTRAMSSTQSSEDVKCNKSEQHTNIPVQRPAVECRCRQTSKTLTFPRLLCPFAITTTSFICLIPQKNSEFIPAFTAHPRHRWLPGDGQRPRNR